MTDDATGERAHAPDAVRPPVGTLDWGRVTGGNLTSRERRQLLGAMLRTAAHYLAGRLRMAVGLTPARLARLDLEQLQWPSSSMARDAERAARETLSVTMLNHSYRTFVFGVALATLDEVPVDHEELYTAALLHDLALETPAVDRCFATRGAERAHDIVTQAGASVSAAHRIAEAISLHITPGLTMAYGPLGPLVAAGALVDITGHRIWDVHPDLIAAAVARYPRADCKHHLAACWRREAQAVPAGRAAVVERYAAFSLFVRLAPYKE